MKIRTDQTGAAIQIAQIRARLKLQLACLRYGTIALLAAGLLTLAIWSERPFRLRALFFEFHSGISVGGKLEPDSWNADPPHEYYPD